MTVRNLRSIAPSIVIALLVVGVLVALIASTAARPSGGSITFDGRTIDLMGVSQIEIQSTHETTVYDDSTTVTTSQVTVTVWPIK